MGYPEDLKYSKEHEWVKVEGDVAVIGITDYAQEQLGDIVMVELPSEGDVFAKDDTFGVVESVKSVNDVFTPVAGAVVEVNDTILEGPGVLNEDCYGEGWLIKVQMSNPTDLKDLMDAKAYEAYISEEE